MALCVVGCPSGTYGAECSQQCQCHNGASCDAVTGHCNCAPGKTLFLVLLLLLLLLFIHMLPDGVVLCISACVNHLKVILILEMIFTFLTILY